MNNMGENNNIEMYNGMLMELADQDEIEESFNRWREE